MHTDIPSISTTFSEYDLKRIVKDANTAMEQKNHEEVFRLALLLVNLPCLEVVHNVSYDRNGEEIQRAELLLSIAVLGMLRILHVDINNQLKNSPPEDLQQTLLENVLAMQAFYQSIVIQALPHFTIHQSPINLEIEIAQDIGNTFKIIDDLSKAIDILWRAIEKSRKTDKQQRIQKTQDDINDLEFFEANAQQAVDAHLSSQAVCEMRLGTMIDDVGLLAIALIHQWRSMGVPNVDRLIDMHLITLKHLKEHKKDLLNVLPTMGIVLSSVVTFVRHPRKFFERAGL